MIIISDTSAISALLRLGHLDIMPNLFGEVIISDKVFSELKALAALNVNMEPLLTANWLKIKTATPGPLLSHLSKILEAGEAHSIALSVELEPDRLIIDERKGRRVAEGLQIKCIGLGGVLVRAKEEGLIEAVTPILDRLRGEIGFYMSQRLRDAVLALANEQQP